MKKTFVAGMCCALMWAVAGLSPAYAAGPTFAQVVDGVDGKKHTKAATKENWSKVKGQEVSWSGVVQDVVTKRKGKAVIYVADKSRPLYKGYNIKVETTELDKATKLKKGQTLRFKGNLDGYSSKNPGAVIEVENATF